MVEEVNKPFAGFDNMQVLYLYTSFSCTALGIYLRNSCRKASQGFTCGLKHFRIMPIEALRTF